LGFGLGLAGAIIGEHSPVTVSSGSTTSKAAKKETQSAAKKKFAPKKAQTPDDDVLSFEQKKDLSEAIQTLDGQKLERIIQIIHEGVAEIRDVRSLTFGPSLPLNRTDRAKRRLSWRSTRSLHPFSPSYTTLSFVVRYHLCHADVLALAHH